MRFRSHPRSRRTTSAQARNSTMAFRRPSKAAQELAAARMRDVGCATSSGSPLTLLATRRYARARAPAAAAPTGRQGPFDDGRIRSPRFRLPGHRDRRVDYAGPAGDLVGVAGSIAIPLWILVELRRALSEATAKQARVRATRTLLYSVPGEPSAASVDRGCI